MHTTLVTVVAMLAFAANSLLCRLALGQHLLDPASFTAVRAVSGAAILALIVLLRRRMQSLATVNWRTGAALFVYMAFFSFAYLSLSAGTGALLLFGSVQLTMFVAALRAREYFSLPSWAGLVLAILGLVYLVSPGLAAPDPLGALLMIIAGVAWGFYSLWGKESANPVEATARNFLFSVPLTLFVCLVFRPSMSITQNGTILAMASGAITSGLGYVVWYAALPKLTATRAATVQLSVPVIAALGGVVVLSEQITIRLLLASAATLGGVAIVLAQRVAKSTSG